MIILRPTLDLAKRFQVQITKLEPLLKDPFNDWTGSAVLINGRQYIMLVNGVTLLPVVLEIYPYAVFLGKFPQGIHNTLLAIGLTKPQTSKLCSSMHEVSLGRANNRSVIRVISEYKSKLNEWVKGHCSYTPLQMSVHLSQLVLPALGNQSSAEFTLELLMQKQVVSS